MCIFFSTQAALNYALQASSSVARQRYQDHGRPITFSADTSHLGGFDWAPSGIDYHEDDAVSIYVAGQHKNSDHYIFILINFMLITYLQKTVFENILKYMTCVISNQGTWGRGS